MLIGEMIILMSSKVRGQTSELNSSNFWWCFIYILFEANNQTSRINFPDTRQVESISFFLMPD